VNEATSSRFGRSHNAKNAALAGGKRALRETLDVHSVAVWVAIKYLPTRPRRRRRLSTPFRFSCRRWWTVRRRSS